MSTVVADSFQNPYASPVPETRPAPATVPAEKPGSLGLIFGGFVLLLAGYFTSNLFLIFDLYHVPFGSDGQVIPSPLAAAASTAAQRWLLYVVCASAFVSGAVMIGSQRFNPMAVVCYVMCPLIGLIYLIASPLRMARKHAEAVATVYLLIGSCLAFTGGIQLFRLYGLPTNGFAPVGASLMTEAGLVLIVGAIIKFLRIPAKAAGTGAEIFVAEVADGLPAQQS